MVLPREVKFFKGLSISTIKIMTDNGMDFDKAVNHLKDVLENVREGGSLLRKSVEAKNGKKSDSQQ